MKKRRDPDMEQVKASWAFLAALALIVFVCVSL